MSNLLPGYMTLPVQSEQDFETVHRQAVASSRCAPNQLSYWQNYPQIPRQPA